MIFIPLSPLQTFLFWDYCAVISPQGEVTLEDAALYCFVSQFSTCFYIVDAKYIGL